jgi:hypothetical protein
MTITVEDGSIVANANSYIDLYDLSAYAQERNITLPETDEEQTALVFEAMDYLSRYRGRWAGDRVSNEQELDFPRSGIYVDGSLLPDDEIPRELFYAQLALAVAANETTLQPISSPTDSGAVIEKTVHGAVTLRYANSEKVLSVAAVTKATTLINLLLKNSGLEVVRA